MNMRNAVFAADSDMDDFVSVFEEPNLAVEMPPEVFQEPETIITPVVPYVAIVF